MAFRRGSITYSNVGPANVEVVTNVPETIRYFASLPRAAVFRLAMEQTMKEDPSRKPIGVLGCALIDFSGRVGAGGNWSDVWGRNAWSPEGYVFWERLQVEHCGGKSLWAASTQRVQCSLSLAQWIGREMNNPLGLWMAGHVWNQSLSGPCVDKHPVALALISMQCD